MRTIHPNHKALVIIVSVTTCATLLSAQPAPVRAPRNRPAFDKIGPLKKAEDLRTNQIRKSVQEIMQKATLMSVEKGWPDPVFAGVGACCRPGETKTSDVSNLKLEYAKGTNKNNSKSDQSVYAVPPCWTITKYRRVQTQDLGPNSASEAVTPANYVMSSSKTYQAEFQTTKDYVLNLNIPDVIKADITAKLDEFVKNYSSYASSLQTSHASIIHGATIQGAGKFNGRTIYEAHYEVTETCCPQPIRDAADLRQLLKGWVDGVVAKLPK